MIEIPGPAPSPLRAPEVRHVDRTGTSFSHALQRSAMSTVFLARDRNPLSRQHHTPRPIVPCSRTQHCLGVTPSPSTDKLLQYPRGALYYPQRSEPVFSDNRVIHNLVETKTNIVSSCVRTFLIILLCEYGVLCDLNIAFNVITLDRHFYCSDIVDGWRNMVSSRI